MNRRTIPICLATASCLFQVAARANDIEPTKEKYTAPFTLTPITVDGNLAEWAGVSVIADPMFAIPKGSGASGTYVLFEEYAGGTWTGPEDQTSAVQVVYDVDNVYFGFVVTDDYHENAASSAWNGDSVQLMIANGGRDVQVALYNYALGGVEGAITDVIVNHEAGPGADPLCECETQAIVVRDAAAKKTYYEIKLPKAALGLTALTPGTQFGLGMAINDGDELTPGQKGWGGLGAHAIVFGKTPAETALVTLGASQPTIEVLGIGTEALLGGDLTDPENDGNEAAGPTDPSWNWVSINSNDEPFFNGGEGSFNIFDNVVGGGDAKWCCTDPSAANPLWVAVQFPQPVSLTHFTITSGNDTPDRRPTKWQIQGSNDGQTYVPVFVQDDPVALWTENDQVLKITLPMPSVPFRYLRYYVTETPGTLHQLGEIEYFGIFGGSLAYYSAINPAITTFSFRINDFGTSVVDPASVKLSIDGQAITLPTPTKVNGVIDVLYTPPTQFLPGSVHTYAMTAKDGLGNNINTAGEWTTAQYALLTADLKVTPDTSKRGFIWRVHQNSAFQANNSTRPLEQLAGLLGENYADPDAQGIAIGRGTPGANNRLPIQFEIDTFINMSQNGADNAGDFTTDDVMPGIPGINPNDTTPTDGIAGDIITYIDLPVGKHTLVVRSDDGFRTTAGNIADVFLAQRAADSAGAVANTAYTVYVQDAGVYAFRTVWEEGGGGANVEWSSVLADGTTRVLLNDTAGGSFMTYRAATSSLTAITSVSPAINASDVLATAPIEVVIQEGATTVDTASVKLFLNGNALTPTTVDRAGKTITVKHQPATPLGASAPYAAKVSFTHGGTERVAEWSFRVPGATLDKLHSYPGLLLGSVAYTPDKGGHTGQAGDYAMDLGTGGGTPSVKIPDASFLNATAAGDVMTFSIWLKRYDINASSAFWADSPSSPSSMRGFQAHVPWSDNTVYFDTAGCCNVDETRISALITDFAPYQTVGNDGWWTNQWHHFAFVKNAGTKQIWIDGGLFLEGGGFTPLPSDFARIWLGAEGGASAGLVNNMHGLLDDFAAFGTALTEAQIGQLASGTLPSALPATAKALAYWDFNDVTVTPPVITIAGSGANITITWTNGGTLQGSPAVVGAGVNWQNLDSDGAYNTTATGAAMFFRVMR